MFLSDNTCCLLDLLTEPGTTRHLVEDYSLWSYCSLSLPELISKCRKWKIEKMKCNAITETMLVWSWSPLTFTSRHQCALRTHCQTDKSLGPSSPTLHASLLSLTSVRQPCFMQYQCQGFGLAISFEAKNLNIQSESNSNFWLHHVVALTVIPSSVYKLRAQCVLYYSTDGYCFVVVLSVSNVIKTNCFDWS